MSIRCVAERYNATRIMLRISADYLDDDMDDAANLLAEKCEETFVTDGSNIFPNIGRWKGEAENGRTIEIVARMDGMLEIADHLNSISRYVNVALNMTCFATVEQTTAFELYELAE